MVILMGTIITHMTLDMDTRTTVPHRRRGCIEIVARHQRLHGLVHIMANPFF
jgi:hypothetical protein